MKYTLSMIIFSPHSILKLEQRNLRKERVLEALAEPEITSNSYGGRRIIFKKFGKLYLKVVFRKENKDIIIITQHWTDKLK